MVLAQFEHKTPASLRAITAAGRLVLFGNDLDPTDEIVWSSPQASEIHSRTYKAARSSPQIPGHTVRSGGLGPARDRGDQPTRQVEDLQASWSALGKGKLERDGVDGRIGTRGIERKREARPLNGNGRCLVEDNVDAVIPGQNIRQYVVVQFGCRGHPIIHCHG